MGPQQTGRRGNAGERSPVPVAAEDPVDPPLQTRAVTSEAASDLEDGRLEDLAASLGLTISDVRRTIEGVGGAPTGAASTSRRSARVTRPASPSPPWAPRWACRTPRSGPR
jgi:hypothetical protein